jgi:uncharacterized protein with PIN domain
MTPPVASAAWGASQFMAASSLSGRCRSNATRLNLSKQITAQDFARRAGQIIIMQQVKYAAKIRERMLPLSDAHGRFGRSSASLNFEDCFRSQSERATELV